MNWRIVSRSIASSRRNAADTSGRVVAVNDRPPSRRGCLRLAGAALVVLLGVVGCSPLTTGERAPHPGFSVGADPRTLAYPAWFLDMPADSAPCAVGYAPAYASLESAHAAAHANACENLALSLGVRIHGERGFSDGGGGRGTRGSTIAHDAVHSAPPGACAVIDSSVVGGMVLALVSETDLTVDRTLRQDPPRPGWIASVPRAAGHDHAVGVSKAYYYRHNAWLGAERHAREQLALSRMTHASTLNRRDGSDASTVAVHRTDVVLTDVRVVSRYHDADADLYYVLVRCAAATDSP